MVTLQLSIGRAERLQRGAGTANKFEESDHVGAAHFGEEGVQPVWFEVEPYRGFARCILAIFHKYAIFAQF